MGTKTLVNLAVLGFSLSAAAWGADSVDEHLVVIGRHTESPLNIAANVTLISADEIAHSGATDLAGVLRGQGGIQISDDGTGPVFAMRGFGAGEAANNTLILVDGRRLNHIDIAAPDLASLSLSQIARIEVLSGSAGVLYGDQAVGGVINIITKAPEGKAVGGSVIGDNFHRRTGAADLHTDINEHWQLFVAGSVDTSDNYRDHAASDTINLLGRLEYRAGPGQFFAEAALYDDERQLAGALTESQLDDNPRQANPANGSDWQHNSTTSARMGYRQPLTDNWQLSTDLDYSDTEVDHISWGDKGSTRRSLLAFSPRLLGNFVARGRAVNLIGGLDLSRGDSSLSSTFMDRGNTQQMWAAFVQASVPLNRGLSYLVGGRYAGIRDKLWDQATMPVAKALDNHAHALEFGFNYRPSQAQRLYLRAEDNFRFAKVDEQAYTSQDSLRPQTGRSIEAGWNYQTSDLEFGINLYRLTLEDEIVFAPEAPTPVGGLFPGANINADASRRLGAMLDWDWQPLDGLMLGLDYQFTDAKFTAGRHDGKNLSWVARHSGRLSAAMDIDESWRLYLDAAYQGKRFVEGDNDNQGKRLTAYWLTNAAVSYRHDALTLTLRADNLLNTLYVASGYYSDWGNGYYPGEGRKVSLKLALRY